MKIVMSIFNRFFDNRFIRFCGNSDYRGFRGRRIRIRPQNLGGTIFSGSGPHFCMKFWHNSRTVGRMDSEMSPWCFPSNFTYGCCTLRKFWKVQFLKNVRIVTTVRVFFRDNLSNSVDFEGTLFSGVFVVAKF